MVSERLRQKSIMSIPTFIKLSRRTINVDEIASVNFAYPGNGIATINLKQMYIERDGAEPDYVHTEGPIELENLKRFLEPNNESDWPIVFDFTKEQLND